MLELKGKHNIAKIFTYNVDKETQGQIIELLNQEFVKDNKVRIMPDCHAGSGCVIGTTMTLKDKVVPNLVGVDIGCGMYAIKLEEDNIDLAKLDNVINELIPSGMNIREHAIATSNIKNLRVKLSDKAIDRAKKSLGTLGGGNHFIEVDKDSNGNFWLVIHTGSRHLGNDVCKYYQNLAVKNVRKDYIQPKIEATVAKLKAEGKEKDIENTIKIINMQHPPIPDELCYVFGKNFEDYIHDMEITQEYALINRNTIGDIIVSEMGLHIVDSFQTIHNYIDIENMILRKGSVSAQAGEKLIIPMNMRDGSLICVGKGNPDWNYSAPHGAGRLMSRAQAKARVSMEEFEESMRGIYSTSVVQSTIDESPMAYKPMDEIIENVKDTVDILDIIKPIYNFKAH